MPDLSILIVNTQSRELLLLGLDAVQRELGDSGWTVVPAGGRPVKPNLGRAKYTGLEPTMVAATTDRTAEVFVLDNASTDGSAEAAAAHPLAPEVIALKRRQGKAASDSDLLARADGRYGLLMNEDAELQPGSLVALVRALDEHPHAAAVGARLVRPDGTGQPSAWAFPSVGGALWAAIGRPNKVVQSTGNRLREVDWAQSAALLVRIDAAREIDFFDRDFFVYSDEVDFAKRLRDAGHTVLWSPDATVIHHEQLSTDLARAQRRIVEFHRGRDRYLRKHHSAPARWAITALTVFTYALRAAAATVLPGHDPARMLAHAKAAARPGQGEGLKEAAEAFNAELTR
ncbi:MAG: glycosyltransferase family 2 protein [Solirubrobacteraceae bacterium]|nr:glycosyltransferase family 2 protein [Solirubrobacteraceae bacterium]